MARGFRSFIRQVEGLPEVEEELYELPADRRGMFEHYLRKFGTPEWAYRDIDEMFTWRHTPQGNPFWSNYRGVTSTPRAEVRDEGDRILRSWQRQLGMV